MRNIVYSNQCLDCKDNGRVSIYLGESSRSAYERGGDHVNDYKSKKEDSHILKHQMSEHSQAAPNYQFRIIARFQSALMRQVTEAVLIRRQGEGTILNSKGVFNRCSLPRLTVEGAGKKEDKEDEARSGLGLEFDKGEEMASSSIFNKKRYKAPNIRAYKPRKRIKIDEKTTKEDNPRLEGLSKRRRPLHEFGNLCKKMRPDFSPELELEFENEEKKPEHKKVQQGDGAENVKLSMKMFSIFSNQLKANENPSKIIQKYPATEKKKVPRKSIVKGKKSLTTSASKPDIRNYFYRAEIKAVTAVQKMKPVPAVASDDSCQLGTNYSRTEAKQGVGGNFVISSRAQESESIWDPTLFKEGTEG